jgi:hypothetical protein
MHTTKSLHELRRIRPEKYASYQRCSVCNLWIAARNRDRHRKACAKRKREQPEVWAEWRNSWSDRTPPS